MKIMKVGDLGQLPRECPEGATGGFRDLKSCYQNLLKSIKSKIGGRCSFPSHPTKAATARASSQKGWWRDRRLLAVALQQKAGKFDSGRPVSPHLPLKFWLFCNWNYLFSFKSIILHPFCFPPTSETPNPTGKRQVCIFLPHLFWETNWVSTIVYKK